MRSDLLVITFIYIDNIHNKPYDYRHKAVIVMPKRAAVIMPDVRGILAGLGERIKLARLRRDLPADLVAERAGVSRATVWAVERGSASVSMGIYAAVLHALGGLDRELEKIAADDELGRSLQDAELISRRCARRSRRSS